MTSGNLHKAKSVYFLGIGGIGVSAIARLCLMEGKKVAGTDRSKSEITDALLKEGAEILIGEQTEIQIPKDVDLIVYSAAIPVAEPEFFARLKEQKIPAISYSEALGEISRDKYTIAIAGTHGKTTTTGMVSTILIDAKMNPTVVIGSVLNRERSNFVFGESDFFVVEADEYRRSFLSLSPTILVINNIDLDHLDYFKDLGDIQSSYRELAEKVPEDGFIIADIGDEKVTPVLQNVKCTVLDYRKAETAGISLPLPGEHNIRNAQVALTIAQIFDIPSEVAFTSLGGFKGTWRRFEKVGEMKCGAMVYDDYAHNPQKISALINGAREYFKGKKLVVVFQPHLYSRTKTLFKGFVEALAKADRIVLADIFPAREAFDSTISSHILAESIMKVNKNVQWFKSFDEIVAELKKTITRDDVVITVGAGDVYKIGKGLVYKVESL